VDSVYWDFYSVAWSRRRVCRSGIQRSFGRERSMVVYLIGFGLTFGATLAAFLLT
jgi:hypothetical protein